MKVEEERRRRRRRRRLEQHKPERREPSARGRTEQQRDQCSELIELELSNCSINKNGFQGREGKRIDSINSGLVREQAEEEVFMKRKTLHWVRFSFNWGIDDFKINSEMQSGVKSAAYNSITRFVSDYFIPFKYNTLLNVAEEEPLLL